MSVMGRRSKAERRATKKTKRANRKLKKADKKEVKGKAKKAKNLRDKAVKLTKKAAKIRNQIDGQIIRGLGVRIVEVNELGNTKVEASWNYQINELEMYDKLLLSIAPSSPLRSTTFNNKIELDISIRSYIFGPMKNLRYTVKLFSLKQGVQKLLDRAIVNKNRR